MDIGAQIKKARKIKGWNQSLFINALEQEGIKVRQQSVSNWERNVFFPEVSTLIKISKVLEKPIGWFFEEEPAPASDPNPISTPDISESRNKQLNGVHQIHSESEKYNMHFRLKEMAHSMNKNNSVKMILYLLSELTGENEIGDEVILDDRMKQIEEEKLQLEKEKVSLLRSILESQNEMKSEIKDGQERLESRMLAMEKNLKESEQLAKESEQLAGENTKLAEALLLLESSEAKQQNIRK